MQEQGRSPCLQPSPSAVTAIRLMEGLYYDGGRLAVKSEQMLRLAERECSEGMLKYSSFAART